MSDQDGYARFEGLTLTGRVYLKELECEGYQVDTQPKTVSLSAGKTAQIEWKNTPITRQLQIYKYAAEYNAVTGTLPGAPIAGAVYEIVDVRSGKVVDQIVTDARGVALTKTGIREVLAGNLMTYTFTVANTSSVPLSTFYFHDKLPYDVTSATAITTGTYSQRLSYRILYKTNMNDYRVLASNLLSTNNYAFRLTGLPLMALNVVFVKMLLKYHISLIELSAISGVPNQRLSEYERGERSASLAKAEKIMMALVCLADVRRKAA